jgi:hypothetical protein
MVGELSRRETNLKKLLEAKDREIEDYKASGAQISRRIMHANNILCVDLYADIVFCVTRNTENFKI